MIHLQAPATLTLFPVTYARNYPTNSSDVDTYVGTNDTKERTSSMLIIASLQPRYRNFL
jgi:hypothetical protein